MHVRFAKHCALSGTFLFLAMSRSERKYAAPDCSVSRSPKLEDSPLAVVSLLDLFLHLVRRKASLTNTEKQTWFFAPRQGVTII